MKEVAGWYLSRKVLVFQNDIDLHVDLNRYMLLICIQNSQFMDAGIMKEIIVRQPLGIAIYANADFFDDLIDLLSNLNSPEKQIMTQLVDEDEIEDFFYANWPSEERFDEWQGYLVYIKGDSKYSAGIKNKIAKILA